MWMNTNTMFRGFWPDWTTPRPQFPNVSRRGCRVNGFTFFKPIADLIHDAVSSFRLCSPMDCCWVKCR